MSRAGLGVPSAEMSLSLRHPVTLAVLLGALCLSCDDPYSKKKPGAEAPPAPAADASADAAAQPSADKPKAKPPRPPKAVPDKHDDGKALGKIAASAPLPLTKMLGQTAAEAESHLGPPVQNSKGGMRDSCVRYLPERTWFTCKFAWQRYTDKTNTFAVVHLTYEDGKVSGIAFENIPGQGPFDARAALAAVGLDLPGEPKVEKPQPEVTVYNWWNARARLIVHGRQYRVRVSTVSDTWDKAKVEIILNDTLTPDEKARVIENPEGKGAPG